MRTLTLASIFVLCGCGAATLAQQGPTPAAPTTPNAAAPDAAPSPKPRDLKNFNVGKDGLALEGMDPVSYFAEGGGKPQRGTTEFTHRHRGVTYRFATREHQQAFAKDPEKFEPAYGGWCAFAMADGKKVEVDAASFTITEGRLCLFYKDFFNDTRKKWLADTAALRPRSDEQWAKIAPDEKKKPK